MRILATHAKKYVATHAQHLAAQISCNKIQRQSNPQPDLNCSLRKVLEGKLLFTSLKAFLI